MIIQCDKCLSKFKLDDSKVTPQGVKVKCKKCSNIFVVYPEKPAEEFTLDFTTEETPKETPKTSQPLMQEEKIGIDLPSFEFTFDNKKGEEKKSEELVINKEPEKEEFSWDQFNIDFGEKKEDVQAKETTQEETSQPAFDFESFGEVKPSAIDTTPKEEAQERKDEVELTFDFEKFAAEEKSPEEEKKGEKETSKTLEEFIFSEPESQPSTTPEETLQEEKELKFDFEESLKTDTESFANVLKETTQEQEVSAQESQAEPSQESGVKFTEEVQFEEPKEEFSPIFESEAATGTKEELEELTDKSASDEFVFVSPEQEKSFVFEEEGVLSEQPETQQKEQQEPQQPFEFEAVKPERNWLVYVISVLIIVLFSGTGVGLIWWQKTKILETEGNFGITGVKTDFYESKTLEKVFVVKGNVVNGYRVPKSFIKVKATIKSKDNKVLATKIVFAGNTFSVSEIKELTYPEIEKGLNNKMGKSMMNVDIPPGKSLPFMIVFEKITEDAASIEVESL